MLRKFGTTLRIVAFGVALVSLVGLSFKGMPLVKAYWEERRHQEQAAKLAANPLPPGLKLSAADPEALVVPAEIRGSFGIQTEAVKTALPSEPLNLDGTLMVDIERMVHVHSRFAGDVVALGEVEETPEIMDGQVLEPGGDYTRPIRFGDFVKKGQLLAVIWSKDLGEKKSELVDNLSQLHLAEDRLKGYKELFEKGSIPEKTVRDQERVVEASLNSVKRVERTLLAWKLTKADLQSIRVEAEELRKHKGASSDDATTEDLPETWARVEVRASRDGVILEKNANVGDYVASELDLFKIADLNRLSVLAYAYEEDLARLERLPQNQRNWTISLKADAEFLQKGVFSNIGNIIEPNQHTALLMGWVNNAQHQLKIGQFVTARIELPSDPAEVEIPVEALIDQEGATFVFVQVQSNDKQSVIERRRVLVVRSRDDRVVLKGDVSTTSPQVPPREGEQIALRPGELVITSGGVELAAALDLLKTDQKKAQPR